MAAGSGVAPPPLGVGLCAVKVEEDSPGSQEPSGSGDWQNPETSRKQFRQLRYQEVAGPEEALSRLWELCRRWLRPELRSKEQIMELLVLEQFLTILPQELQAYVRDHCPESGEEAAALARTLQRALDGASLQSFATFKDVAESLTWEEWEQLAAARKGFCRESTKDPGSTVGPGTGPKCSSGDVLPMSLCSQPPQGCGALPSSLCARPNFCGQQDFKMASIENLSLVPSTYVTWLTAACNSSSRDLIHLSFWGTCTHTCISTQTVPLKEKKLMEVKLRELPSWILMRDFTPSGIAGAFRRGYDRYYNKYINVRKGSISGINMVLAAYVVFSYCISYKELKHERRRKYH
uniref:ATP synthase membrane subunit f n=1 Tax=Rattus norvegicus TaxID=10116 RepID=A0A8I5ZLZ0_RAT